MSADKNGAVKCYEEAVKTRPADEKAYLALLEDVYLADGVFSREEADAMIRLLGYKGSRDTHSTEEQFKGNKSGYSTFCYDMGLAYFYFYEDTGNRQLSRPWLREAKEGLSDEKKRMRAERLYKVAEYYGSLENRNKAAAKRAVEISKERKERDNITVIAVEMPAERP